MDNQIQMIKWSVRISIGIDIFLVICFVIGFVLASMKVGIGLFLWGIIVFCGVYILAISFILKIFAMILCMPFDTLEKRKYLYLAGSSFIRLLFISGFIYGIYYIGKVMTEVG